MNNDQIKFCFKFYKFFEIKIFKLHIIHQNCDAEKKVLRLKNKFSLTVITIEYQFKHAIALKPSEIRFSL